MVCGCICSSLRVLWTLILISCLFTTAYGQVDITINTIQSTGEALKKWLLRQHNNYTHADIIKKNLHGASVHGVEQRQQLDQALENIVQLLGRKREAVQRMVTALENATRTYQWEDKLETNYSSALYMNGSEYEAAEKLFNSSLSPDPVLGGVQTLRSVAGVHVPVEVYQGYPEIANGVTWSQCLDEVFEENAANDTSLAWQYFAGSAGFTRLYPATRWPVPPELFGADLYDARRRSWFVRGSTRPKDIVILMDRSGSVHGQTFTIMKFAVKTLINTLGEDDFLNVAVFNESVHWAVDCEDWRNDSTSSGESCSNESASSSLVQASTDNKLTLFRVIDEMEDGGMTNYTAALEFAYESLLTHQRKVGGDGGNCHRLIMIFSDGGTDQAQEVMDRFRNESGAENVRIFSYAIGPHPIPTVVLKEMACQTDGLFTVITSTSGVRNLIQESFMPILWRSEYRHKLRSLASKQQHQQQDSVSVSSPSPPLPPVTDDVINSKPPGYIHHLSDPPEAVPSSGDGLHDVTTTPYIDALTLDLTVAVTMPVYNQSAEEPSLVGVAGVDVPVRELESVTVSEALGSTGYFFLVNHNGFVAMHPKLKAHNFYLQDPPNRDLLDLEWPSPQMDTVRTNMVQGRNNAVTRVRHRHLLTDDTHLVQVHDEFRYYFVPVPGTSYSLGMVIRNNSRHLSVPLTFDPNNTFDYYTTSLPRWVMPGTASTNPGLVWSKRWTNELVEYWRRSPLPPSVADTRLAFTRFGLTRFSSTESMRWPEWLQSWQDPRHNPSLKRAEFGEEVSVFPVSAGDEVMVTAPVTHKGLVAASVAINFFTEFITEGFLSELSKAGIDERMTSILLDDGAFVIASQIDEFPTSSFLGSTLGGRVLLDQLVAKKIYMHASYVDHQAICGPPPPPPQSDVSSGRTLRPLVSCWGTLLTSTTDMLTSLTRAYYFVIGVLVSLLAPLAGSLTEFGLTSFEGLSEQPCVVRRTVYTWGGVNSTTAPVICAFDKGQILASRIENSNLVLVSVSGCPVEKTMVYSGTSTASPLDDLSPEEDDYTSSSYYFSSTNVDSGKGNKSANAGQDETPPEVMREVTRFTTAFATQTTPNLPEGGEVERIGRRSWCCEVMERRNIRPCKAGGIQRNNSCSSGGQALRAQVRSSGPLASVLASFVTCLLAAYLAKY